MILTTKCPETFFSIHTIRFRENYKNIIDFFCLCTYKQKRKKTIKSKSMKSVNSTKFEIKFKIVCNLL